MSPARRASLLDEVEAAVASVEARANPLLEDFVGDDVASVFHRHQSWFLPICTAATALLSPSYGAPDGFTVEVVSEDHPANPGDVRARRRDAEDARARRARFLAWPASRSALVRSRDGNAARRVAETLRDDCSKPDSALAIVVDRSLLEGQSPDPRLERVLAKLARGEGRVGADDLPPLRPVVPSRGAPISPWIVLGDTELLVVPKLGALSPVTRFESELRSRLRGTNAEIEP